MMAGNTALSAAKRAKQDEFYTQLSDIEKELRYYRKHFKDKVVLCNCDDPFESNFFKYFVLNFNKLGIKKLIATSYVGSPIAGKQLKYQTDKDGQIFFSFEGDSDKRPYKAEVTTVYDKTGDDAVEMLDIAELFKSGENELSLLSGDGDFRSEECLALLDDADIVVTNPPFSLFREYVATLIDHGKNFIIIGNKNAIHYKEIFPLLKENKMWIGYRNLNEDMWFIVPEGYKYEKVLNGQKIKHIMGCWFTNLDIKKRHEKLILVKRYSPKSYPQYDNYNAINVDKVVDIPCDYSGIMGVPLTFMDKYNPDQFEILWQAERSTYANAPKNVLEMIGFDPSVESGGGLGVAVLNGKPMYTRILIRNKNPEHPKEA